MKKFTTGIDQLAEDSRAVRQIPRKAKNGLKKLSIFVFQARQMIDVSRSVSTPNGEICKIY